MIRFSSNDAHDSRDLPRTSRNGPLANIPFWALSTFIHLVIFLILFAMVVEQPRKEPRRQLAQITLVPTRETPAPKRMREREVLESLVNTETPPLPEPIPELVLEPELEELVTDPPTEQTATQHNELENALFEVGMLGAAPGARPGKLGDMQALISAGGNAEAESAIWAALDWLCRHQSDDGSWKAREFTRQCKKTYKSRNAARYGPGLGLPRHDVGVTALALLAFAGYAHTHQYGKYPRYVQAVKRGVKYLKSVQVSSTDPNKNGRFGSEDHKQWIYDHAIATMAMSELLAMSDDVIVLKRSVTDAVGLCLRAQNTGFGWKYGIKPGNNDTSVTGWMVLALKTAKNANIDVRKSAYDRAFEGALNSFAHSTSAASGKTGYEAPGDEGSMLTNAHTQETYPYSKELSCMTAVAMLCRLLPGQSRGAPAIKRGVDILIKETPRSAEQKDRQLSTINVYYWYYGSYAMFQFGGSLWKRWNKAMLTELLSSQRREIDESTGQPLDEDGSWDPIGEWGAAGGRVYSTAMAAMTRQVYYRYQRVARATRQQRPK